MKIYRLENYKGLGPFSASQNMVKYLISHNDPETMLESVGLSAEEFQRVTDFGLLFGWSTREFMKNFFRNPEKAIKKASDMKMKISVYEEDNYFLFEDGQVMFLKTTEPIERISLRDFLSA